MLAEEVAALYRTWVDESSSTWHTSVISTILKAGYSAFRRKVIEQQPFIYANSVDLAVSGYSYNLQTGPVSVLGSAPTDPRMEKALDLRYIDADGRIGSSVKLVADPSQLMRSAVAAACLRASVLEFNWQVSETLRFWYVTESTVDWTKIVVGNNEYIDDLGSYHELIAVYAAEYYGIRDNAAPRVQSIKKTLERSFIDFLFHYQGDQLEIGSIYG